MPIFRASWCALGAAALLAILALLALAGTARAQSGTTLYVAANDPGCSDGGPATAEQPLCSISAAASRVTAGQTVLVSAGTYDETVVVERSGTASDPIRFAAVPGDDVVVGGDTHGFYLSSRANVTIEGFEVADTDEEGIVVKHASRITVRGNEVHHAGEQTSDGKAKGIRIEDTVDSVVTDNTVHHATDYGIYVVASSGIEVTRNESFANARGYERAASGIRLHSSPGNTVASNVSHDNEDSGIELVTGSAGNLVVNNVTYRNDDHGIDVSIDCTDVRVIANTVHGSTTSGINVEGGSTGATVMNNIAVDNAVNSSRGTGNIRVDATSTPGTAVDYDLVYVTGGGRNFEWAGIGYGTLDQFRAASGQEAHGIEAPPGWAAASSDDFRLASGSPAIDSANSSASGQTSTDIDGNARFDDPGMPNTGAGTRTYDDRGAYERQSGSAPGNAPPDANLAVTPSSGDAPLEVTADASGSHDPDGSIVSYRFDFGDGSSAVGPQSGATATHAYTVPGTYTVTVTVTDDDGATSTAAAPVQVGGSVNLVTNPGFETDLSRWNTSPSGLGIALTRVEGGHSGDWAAKLANTGTSASTCALNDSPDFARPTTAAPYSAALWVRADSSGATLKARWTEYVGTTKVGSVTQVVTLSTSWQRVELDYTPASPGSTLDLNVYIIDASPGTCFYADDVSIEVG